jgi:hypothetical protein
LWDPELGLYLDHDLRADEPLRSLTVAGFAPLVAGHMNSERLEALLETLDSTAFTGHPRLRWPLPPSTSPEDPGFHRRSSRKHRPKPSSTKPDKSGSAR